MKAGHNGLKAALPALFLAAALPLANAADGPKFSGVFTSTLNAGAGTGALPDFFYGVEEYANIRLSSSLSDAATAYMSFNLLAASGASALALSEAAFGVSAQNQNYTAALELERLYFHAGSSKTGFDGGLMRLAFGFGAAFRPTDFFNQQNPLTPDARLRAILGAAFSYFPSDMSELSVFTVAPRDSAALTPRGSFSGVSAEAHGDTFSVQGLYFFEPLADSSRLSGGGCHYAGLSLKADLALGVVAEALYAYKGEASGGVDSLAASAGIDYTFTLFNNSLIMFIEYLYSGDKSATALSETNASGYTKNNYAYASFTYNLSDLTNIALAALVCADDGSFQPIASFNHDLFQGGALGLQARVPLDSGSDGALGPKASSSYAAFTVKFTLRL